MQQRFHEERLVGLLMTFVGGAMDGDTYIHYEAFASAQTGNLILAIIQGFDGQWGSVMKKLLSTLCFLCGIYLAKFVADYCQEKGWHFWRLFVLYYEGFVFFLVSLPAINEHPAFVTMLIAFTAAIQWIAFDKIKGMSYTNLFTTGNLKGLASHFYEYRKTRAEEEFEQLIHFVLVVVFFILGAVSSIGLYHLVGFKAILLVTVICLCLSIYATYMLWRFSKSEFSR